MSKKKIAVFPGSFDPFTVGHKKLVLRALPLFDKIVVAIGDNSDKHCMFALEQRKKMIEQAFEGVAGVETAVYSCLTTDFCKKTGARYILRGLRNFSDFEYEKNIADINLDLDSEIETVFLLTDKEDSNISSSFVREMIRFDKDVSKYLPFDLKTIVGK